MDLNLRKMASTALVAIAVWMAFAALLFRDTGAPAVNAFFSAVGLAVFGLAGRQREHGSIAFFSLAVAVSVWLFFSTWAIPGATTAVVVNNLFFSVLAFGFACAPIATPPRATA